MGRRGLNYGCSRLLAWKESPDCRCASSRCAVDMEILHGWGSIPPVCVKGVTRQPRVLCQGGQGGGRGRARVSWRCWPLTDPAGLRSVSLHWRKNCQRIYSPGSWMNSSNWWSQYCPFRCWRMFAKKDGFGFGSAAARPLFLAANGQQVQWPHAEPRAHGWKTMSVVEWYLLTPLPPESGNRSSKGELWYLAHMLKREGSRSCFIQWGFGILFARRSFPRTLAGVSGSQLWTTQDEVAQGLVQPKSSWPASTAKVKAVSLLVRWATCGHEGWWFNCPCAWR